MIVPIGLIKYYTGEDFLRTLYVQADRPEDVPELTSEVAQLVEQPPSRAARNIALKIWAPAGFGAQDFAGADGDC